MYIGYASMVTSKESHKWDTGFGIVPLCSSYLDCLYVAYVVGLICVQG